MEIKILYATFELSDPENCTIVGDETGRLSFPGVLQGKQGVMAGSTSSAGVVFLYGSSPNFVSLVFDGVANRTIEFPDESGKLALSDQTLNTDSAVTFESVRMNWLQFDVVGENAEVPVPDGDYVIVAGSVIQTRRGIITQITPP